MNCTRCGAPRVADTVERFGVTRELWRACGPCAREEREISDALQKRAGREARIAASGVAYAEVYPTLRNDVDGALAALDSVSAVYYTASPGCGATTLCRAVVLEGMDRWDCSGRYLRMGQLLETHIDPADWAAYTTAGIVAVDEWMRRRQPLTGERTLWLLDRLDEWMSARQQAGLRTLLVCPAPAPGMKPAMAWAQVVGGLATRVARWADYGGHLPERSDHGY